MLTLKKIDYLTAAAALPVVRCHVPIFLHKSTSAVRCWLVALLVRNCAIPRAKRQQRETGAEGPRDPLFTDVPFSPKNSARFLLFQVIYILLFELILFPALRPGNAKPAAPTTSLRVDNNIKAENEFPSRYRSDGGINFEALSGS